MAISYKKLWHLLIDRDLKKSALVKEAGVGWPSLSKLNRGENIGTDVLLRICNYLDCDISDIMEITRDKQPEEK